MGRSLGQTLRADYARRETKIRGELRKSMNAELGEGTRVRPSKPSHVLTSSLSVRQSGDPQARMRWTVRGFYLYVYRRYGLKLVGWDCTVLFTNPSHITGLVNISRLATRWERGELHFEPVTAEELEAARLNPLLAAPGPRHHGYRTPAQRKDVKKRRPRSKKDLLGYLPRYERNGPKSQKWVTEEAELWASQPQGRELEEDPIESFSDDEEWSGRSGFRAHNYPWSGSRPGRIVIVPLRCESRR